MIQRKKPLKRGAPPKRSSKPIKRRRIPKAFHKHRDMKYQEWIRTLGCLICGKHPVDPAHVIPRGRGSDDRKNLVPLCRPHHDEQEKKNPAFEAKYGVNLVAEALRLDAEYTESE